MAERPEERGLTLDDLRPGDVVLLEASVISDDGTQYRPDPIGRTAELLDGTRYSHAVVLEARTADGRDFTCFSANQGSDRAGVDPPRNGVNRLSLRMLNSDVAKDGTWRTGRPMVVLRHSDDERAAAAVLEGRGWVEEGGQSSDPSDFGWDQIVLSGASCVARRLAVGSLRRAVLGGVARRVSEQLLVERPRPAGNPRHDDGGEPDRWDCCQFVDHLFSTSEQALGTLDVDPAPQGDALALLVEVLAMWGDELKKRVCRDVAAQAVESTAAIDTAVDRFLSDVPGIQAVAWGGPIRDLFQMLWCIGPFTVDDVPAAPEVRTRDDEAVWAPFNSPRLLLEATGALKPIGEMPAGSL